MGRRLPTRMASSLIKSSPSRSPTLWLRPTRPMTSQSPLRQGECRPRCLPRFRLRVGSTNSLYLPAVTTPYRQDNPPAPITSWFSTQPHRSRSTVRRTRPFWAAVGRLPGAIDATAHFMDRVEAIGFRDLWRHRYPDGREYSWYSHRGNGFRIDHAFLSPGLAARAGAMRYSHEERLAGLSDHSVLLLELPTRRRRRGLLPGPLL